VLQELDDDVVGGQQKQSGFGILGIPLPVLQSNMVVSRCRGIGPPSGIPCSGLPEEGIPEGGPIPLHRDTTICAGYVHRRSSG